jgi:predicted DNA binding CopG/RHH family protein
MKKSNNLKLNVMKNIISIMLVAAFGVMLVFTGCKEEEYVPEELQTVTIQGQVLTDLDLTDADFNFVPDGTKIIFRINSSDLVAVPEAGYNYQTLQYETTVKDGLFTIALPTVNFNAVGVEVVLDPFIAEQTDPLDDDYNMIFEASDNYDFTITEGEAYFFVYNYDMMSLYDF